MGHSLCVPVLQEEKIIILLSGKFSLIPGTVRIVIMKTVGSLIAHLLSNRLCKKNNLIYLSFNFLNTLRTNPLISPLIKQWTGSQLLEISTDIHRSDCRYYNPKPHACL